MLEAAGGRQFHGTISQCPSMPEAKQFMSQDTRCYLLPVVSYHCVKLLLYLYEYIQEIWTELLEYSSAKIYCFLLCCRRKIYSFPYFPFEKQYICRQKGIPFFFPPEGSEFLNIWEIYIYSIKWKNNFVLK